MDEQIDPNSERAEFLYGRGGWPAFHRVGAKLADIEMAAADWASQIQGIEKPWLVWNAHHDWCWVQQQIVEILGWTPVVGFDPRIGPPTHTVKKAVVVDFNKDLQLNFLHPVFVLEFVYLFAEKLAFWHSDLLLHPNKLSPIVKRFENLKQGETIATSTWSHRRFWRRPKRVWELLGCTTREASKDQFEKGTGWWCNIPYHINCPSEEEACRRKEKIWWDHGGGILYWARHCGGKLNTIPITSVEYGHFSPTSHPGKFRRTGDPSSRNLEKQLNLTIDLADACKTIGISNLLIKN